MKSMRVAKTHNIDEAMEELMIAEGQGGALKVSYWDRASPDVRTCCAIPSLGRPATPYSGCLDRVNTVHMFAMFRAGQGAISPPAICNGTVWTEV